MTWSERLHPYQTIRQVAFERDYYKNKCDRLIEEVQALKEQQKQREKQMVPRVIHEIGNA